MPDTSLRVSREVSRSIAEKKRPEETVDAFLRYLLKIQTSNVLVRKGEYQIEVV
jgi:hypothetical protein